MYLSRLHLQTLAPVSRRVDVRQAAGRKNLYHNMIKNMLYRPHLVWEKGWNKNTQHIGIFVPYVVGMQKNFILFLFSLFLIANSVFEKQYVEIWLSNM
jgi:hypothetical protein